jgi:hypothetical protein
MDLCKTEEAHPSKADSDTKAHFDDNGRIKGARSLRSATNLQNEFTHMGGGHQRSRFQRSC